MRTKDQDVHESKGRTPGDQSNDASEARAILQALLHTNPHDPLQMYCDNQGCVDTWEKEGGTQQHHKMNNRAIWNRIYNMKDMRRELGTPTTMHWIQSHVQSEQKRTSNRSNRQCACRKGSTRKECTTPGDLEHWMHEGNDKADELAKGTIDMEPINCIEEVARGEEEFILKQGQRVAQGNYREWLAERAAEAVLNDPDSVGMRKMEAARKATSTKIWPTILSSLDNIGVSSNAGLFFFSADFVYFIYIYLCSCEEESKSLHSV